MTPFPHRLNTSPRFRLDNSQPSPRRRRMPGCPKPRPKQRRTSANQRAQPKNHQRPVQLTWHVRPQDTHKSRGTMTDIHNLSLNYSLNFTNTNLFTKLFTPNTSPNLGGIGQNTSNWPWISGQVTCLQWTLSARQPPWRNAPPPAPW